MTKAFMTAALAALCLGVAACASQKEPAEQAFAAVEAKFKESGAEIQKYLPERYAEIEASVASLRDSMSKESYGDVVAEAGTGPGHPEARHRRGPRAPCPDAGGDGIRMGRDVEVRARDDRRHGQEDHLAARQAAAGPDPRGLEADDRRLRRGARRLEQGARPR